MSTILGRQVARRVLLIGDMTSLIVSNRVRREDSLIGICGGDCENEIADVDVDASGSWGLDGE